MTTFEGINDARKAAIAMTPNRAAIILARRSRWFTKNEPDTFHVLTLGEFNILQRRDRESGEPANLSIVSTFHDAGNGQVIETHHEGPTVTHQKE